MYCKYCNQKIEKKIKNQKICIECYREIINLLAKSQKELFYMRKIILKKESK